MQTVEIVEWVPTSNLRWYSPDRLYVPEVLQRRFDCKADDGTSGQIWADVYPENTFIRKPSNANVTGPAPGKDYK